MYNPPHPGEFMREVYLEPLGISYRTVAAKLKTILILLAILLAGASGCTYVHHVAVNQAAYDSLDAVVRGKKASVTFTSEKQIWATIRSVTLDSVALIQSKSHTEEVFPTAQIREITILKRSGKGARNGFKAGVIAGSLLGALMWSGLNDYPDSGDYITGAMMGGLAGGVLGAGVGAAVGSEEMYRLSELGE